MAAPYFIRKTNNEPVGFTAKRTWFGLWQIAKRLILAQSPCNAKFSEDKTPCDGLAQRMVALAAVFQYDCTTGPVSGRRKNTLAVTQRQSPTASTADTSTNRRPAFACEHGGCAD